MRVLVRASFALLLCGAASPAFAQSSPDWTGFYVGVYGGVVDPDDADDERLRFDRDLNGVFAETVTTTTGADAFSPGFCGGTPLGNNAGAGCSGDETGVEGGVRAGYDWRLGGLVVGAVAEIGGADVEDSVTGFSTTPAAYEFRRELQSLAAIRARVGFALGENLLLYGTGGYARGQVDNSFRTTNGANSFTARMDEEDADGWQAGAGFEYRLAPGLTFVTEYIRTELDAPDYVIRVGQGTAPATNPFVLAPNTTGTDIRRSSDDLTLNSLRIGMNWRF